MQGLSLRKNEAKLFQKRNKTPRNAWAKASTEVKPNCFKKETKPQEMHGQKPSWKRSQIVSKKTKPQETQGLSLRGSEAKLFRKRNKTPRNARAKPSQKQNQIVSKKKQHPNKCKG
jgi:hypothetical protein